MVSEPIRDREEIQRAHDVMLCLLRDRSLFPRLIREEDQYSFVAALDVLCWVLCHDHNQTYADNLAAIEAAVEAAGIEIRRLPEMVYPGKEE